ncbi:hypothetical protein IGB42_00359 [Andreprevotia sp. IGB-42]|uniref:hypothetical protein n=1 Tax=Andreprevotia sp. IGB-42 TaxID=2497473 RepID=UPI001356BA5B|nr:hypothetical protein [Andreprevotia sp. IGB-42]KAF0815278.1 hypothetical protein IGB42_00359 [Andreprevotia sp. IGB-42]
MNPLELLRYLGTTVAIRQVPGEDKPVLARSYPEDEGPEDRRARVCRDWGHASPPQRLQTVETINEALPVREQTILSYALPAEAAAQLQTPARYGVDDGNPSG